MKRAKHLRSLEELWDLEDQYPLLDASAAGLLRWMVATGMGVNPSSKRHFSSRRRPTVSSHRTRNGRS